MFIYKIASKNSAISHLSISGPNVTLWQRGGHEMECNVFCSINMDLFKPIVFAEDIRHPLFHSAGTLSADHHHFTLRKVVGKNPIDEFFERLAKHASKAGQKRAKEFFQAARISLEDQSLTFDDSIPIIPESEVALLRNAYIDYQRNTQLSSSCLINDLKETAHQIYIVSRILSSDNELIFAPYNNVMRELWPNVQDIYTTLRTASYYSNPQQLKNMLIEIDTLLLAKIESIRLADEGFRECSFPVPSLETFLTDLRNHLEIITTLVESPLSSKPVLFSAPLAMLGTALSGVGTLGIALAGIVSGMGAIWAHNKHAWKSLDAYLGSSDNEPVVNDQSIVSSHCGQLAAQQPTRQFLAMFNAATWKYPKEYYTAFSHEVFDSKNEAKKRL